MTKTCKRCTSDFDISSEDLKFYEKVSPVFREQRFLIAPPNLCPDCRRQDRLAFRNEKKLYQRKCDSCQKEIISMYSADVPFKVFCPTCWWGDGWDSTKIGQSFDFSRPFFEQFHELLQNASLSSLLAKNNENSDYVNLETDDKNCYLNAGGHFNEDCYYNTYCMKGKNNVDNYWLIDSELCYMCVNCEKCYSSTYLQDCSNVRDSHYCRDCKDCEHCFGSYGLRHKKYYYFNEELSKDAYEKKVKAHLDSFESREEARELAYKHFLKYPHQASRIAQCEECTGDLLVRCKNLKSAFNFDDSEDGKYLQIGLHLKDAMDITSFGWGELIYKVSSSMNLKNSGFLALSADGHNVWYGQFCWNSSDCFGCVGMYRKQYCILNKQYTKEEYEALLPKVIAHMQKTGEWGQYFPLALSTFCYNESVANDYFPLTKEEAWKIGAMWRDQDTINKYQGPRIAVPSHIKDVTDDITKQILTCVTCNRNYRIVNQELDYYRCMDLPVPHDCLDCRNRFRLSLKNPQKVWERNCAKCSTAISTSYSPDRPETVYCEKCYLETVY